MVGVVLGRRPWTAAGLSCAAIAGGGASKARALDAAVRANCRGTRRSRRCRSSPCLAAAAASVKPHFGLQVQQFAGLLSLR